VIDDILARLRRAHDERRIPNQGAVADRERRRVPRDSDYLLKWKPGISAWRAGEDVVLPSGDEIVVVARKENLVAHGKDGAGPCSAEWCYTKEGAVCPRAEACGREPVPGYSAKIVNWVDTNRRSDG